MPEINGRENIANFAWYGCQGGVHHIDGFKIYPAGVDPYGNDVIGAHARNFNANIVISLIDVWVMKQTAQQIAPALWLPWLPIDADPVPLPVLESLKGAHMPLTYSRWGEKMLNDAGVKNTYIPHGIETSVYKVHTDTANVQAFKRQALKCDGHLSVMVAANKGFPDRKAFQVQIRAWAKFAQDKPDARLYIHTEPTPMYGGIDLPHFIKAVPIAPGVSVDISSKVLFPDRYDYYLGMPPEYLAMVYNAADVLLANSMSEGFGIPIIEAQACGAPVITTDFSSMPELIRWGYKIAPADMVWMALGAYHAMPDVHGITDALNELYAQWEANKGWSMAQRLKVSAQIHSEYSWDSIVRDQWAPFIASIADVAPPLAGAPVNPQEAPAPVVQRALPRRGKITAITADKLMAVNGLDRPEKEVQ